jgi:uncharacterized protein (DUF488 family)
MDSPATQSGTLMSIGYGDRPWDDFTNRLRTHQVEYLVDVRSRPASRQPEFSREALDLLLSQIGVRYVFMGDSLGGQPDDPACYVNGKVDYDAVQGQAFFRDGLARLKAAVAGGHRVALMCSELDPERCHRSKLIGVALEKEHIQLWHIDRDGGIATQAQVLARLTGGQQGLFDLGLTSRRRYRTESDLSQ